jgi:putative glutamine amidotransferase
MTRPKIAFLMDENTSAGGTRYEAAKGYFHSLVAAGGAPFGMPYAPELVEEVVTEFDGLLTAGGRFAIPDEWYAGEAYPSPQTARPAVEVALMRGFLAREKPVLGMCAGMQVLACLHGARMTADLDGHDGRELTHEIAIAPGTLLAGLAGDVLTVNTYHREAIVELGAEVVASARSADGVIEAVELPAHRFALGLQWHQELLGTDHPGQAIFAGFVDACAVNA